jgi:hypothetical protein
MNDILSAIPERWKSAIVLFMVGLLAGTGSSVWRVDKFTGSQGRILAERIAVLEKRIPTTFPPIEWQLQQQNAINSLRSDIESVKADDRHTRAMLNEIKSNNIEHYKEAEPWKRRIERNEQSIDNLWKWYQERMK